MHVLLVFHKKNSNTDLIFNTWKNDKNSQAELLHVAWSRRREQLTSKFKNIHCLHKLNIFDQLIHFCGVVGEGILTNEKR